MQPRRQLRVFLPIRKRNTKASRQFPHILTTKPWRARPSIDALASDVVPSLMGECREQFDSVVAELERLSAHDDAESPAGPVCDACISP